MSPDSLAAPVLLNHPRVRPNSPVASLQHPHSEPPAAIATRACPSDTHTKSSSFTVTLTVAVTHTDPGRALNRSAPEISNPGLDMSPDRQFEACRARSRRWWSPRPATEAGRCAPRAQRNLLLVPPSPSRSRRRQRTPSSCRTIGCARDCPVFATAGHGTPFLGAQRQPIRAGCTFTPPTRQSKGICVTSWCT